MNHVTFVEIPTTNLKKAQAFFGKVFGWKFEPLLARPDVLLINTGKEPGALLYETRTLPRRPGVILHVEVEDVTETVKLIRKARGTIITTRAPSIHTGRLVYFATPDGCTMALWQPLHLAA